ncbi:MAG: hypothetical protein ACI9QD_001150 [Thermoproteota archaeon]|jgi:hypothetical protein
MKKILLIITLSILSIGITFAQAPIEKKNISGVLDLMVSNGMLTAAEAVKAKEQMKAMKQEEWKSLTNKAQEVVERDPALLEKLRKGGQGGTLPQFKGSSSFKEIQESVKKQGLKK